VEGRCSAQQRLGKVEVYLTPPSDEAGRHRSGVEDFADLYCRAGIAEPERCRDGMNRDVDMTERGSHVVRTAGAVNNAARLLQQDRGSAP
jgi:hypothetical protein